MKQSFSKIYQSLYFCQMKGNSVEGGFEGSRFPFDYPAAAGNSGAIFQKLQNYCQII